MDSIDPDPDSAPTATVVNHLDLNLHHHSRYPPPQQLAHSRLFNPIMTAKEWSDYRAMALQRTGHGPGHRIRQDHSYFVEDYQHNHDHFYQRSPHRSPNASRISTESVKHPFPTGSQAILHSGSALHPPCSKSPTAINDPDLPSPSPITSASPSPPQEEILMQQLNETDPDLTLGRGTINPVPRHPSAFDSPNVYSDHIPADYSEISRPGLIPSTPQVLPSPPQVIFSPAGPSVDPYDSVDPYQISHYPSSRPSSAQDRIKGQISEQVDNPFNSHLHSQRQLLHPQSLHPQIQPQLQLQLQRQESIPPQASRIVYAPVPVSTPVQTTTTMLHPLYYSSLPAYARQSYRETYSPAGSSTGSFSSEASAEEYESWQLLAPHSRSSSQSLLPVPGGNAESSIASGYNGVRNGHALLSASQYPLDLTRSTPSHPFYQNQHQQQKYSESFEPVFIERQNSNASSLSVASSEGTGVHGYDSARTMYTYSKHHESDVHQKLHEGTGSIGIRSSQAQAQSSSSASVSMMNLPHWYPLQGPKEWKWNVPTEEDVRLAALQLSDEEARKDQKPLLSSLASQLQGQGPGHEREELQEDYNTSPFTRARSSYSDVEDMKGEQDNLDGDDDREGPHLSSLSTSISLHPLASLRERRKARSHVPGRSLGYTISANASARIQSYYPNSKAASQSNPSLAMSTGSSGNIRKSPSYGQLSPSTTLTASSYPSDMTMTTSTTCHTPPPPFHRSQYPSSLPTKRILHSTAPNPGGSYGAAIIRTAAAATPINHIDPESGIPLCMMPTKRSRGRRPVISPELDLDPDIDHTTASSLAQVEFSGVTKTGKPRKIFVCRVPGCDKCFRRAEHLKRHVRSLHTNYKREFNQRPKASRRREGELSKAKCTSRKL